METFFFVKGILKMISNPVRAFGCPDFDSSM